MTARPARSARLALALGLVGVAAGGVPAVAQGAPPTGVTGMALDARVEVAWQPVAGASSYNVYRGTSPSTVTTPVSLSGIPPPPFEAPASFTDTTAANGTTYYYAVRAVVDGQESANSALIAATPRARNCSGGNLVVQENCFPGATDWKVDAIPAGVAGYATAQSIDHGQSIGLKVQSPTSTVDIELFRNGHYGGSGARLFSRLVNVPVSAQPACSNNASTGLVDCSNWSLTRTITTTESWPSGVYLARIVRTDTGRGTHALFVVRDDSRQADILYGLPFTTYQAYNNWGGKSLYNHNSSGAATVSGEPRAVKVSFDRPYLQQEDNAAHDWYTRTDQATVAWLERSGYDVSYHSGSELDSQPGRALQHRVYLSGSHDEYYTAGMRSALEQARDQGVDLFFTGANEIFWKVRFEPSPLSGGQDRVLVCYKTSQSGPPDPSGIHTGTWRDPAGANQPENALTGAQFVGLKAYEYFPLRVSEAEGKDRIWRYTGLENQSPGGTTNVGTSLVGWEWDARVANGAEPPGVVTLASSPVTGDILVDNGNSYAPGSTISNAVKHQWPSGALVVSTGTNHWNWGLALNAIDEGEPDRRIRQATTNILADMGALPETAAADIVLDDPSAPPSVPLKIPGNGATNVDPGTTVRATFSRPMDASTINSSSFTLRRPDGSTVPGSVTYDSTSFTATLTPTLPLAHGTAYTARLESTIKAENGIALGQPEVWTFTTRPPDTTPPDVSITAPANGATISATTNVTATATDNDAVAGVQFKLDGANLGGEDTVAPYSHSWDPSTASPGTHQLTAVARDRSGNSRTSAAVTVEVDVVGLVAAYGFEEASGTGVTDSSGKGNGGTIAGATRSTTGKYGKSLSFDGANDRVTVPDAASLDLTSAMTVEAWVSPTATTGWRTVLMKGGTSDLSYGLYSNGNTNRPSVHVRTSNEFDTRGTATVPASTWTHLAGTYDGSTLRLYVNGTQVSTRTLSGPITPTSQPFEIGGNSVWGEFFGGLIDEVRVYRRVLSAAEIGQDMNTPVVPPDTQAPTAPANLAANGGLGQVALNWNAASDNVGVARYNVHRSTTSGFTPSAANRIAQVSSGTSYTDTGMAAGTYHYRVIAEDGAGNLSPASNQATATATADTAAPSVALTAPANGATVSGLVDVTANASDNVGVAGVQFKVDGADVGAEDAASPYSTQWASSSVANGSHTLTAVARDAAGNATTSAPVTVTVNNAPVDTSGLVAAYGFEEGSGATVNDASSSGNFGTITGATRSTAGKFGSALSYDGVNDWVTVPDAASLDLTTGATLEAWVRPTALSDWQTVLMKEQSDGLVYGLYGNANNSRPSGHVFTSHEVDTRGTAALATATWSHLAMTHDGTALRLYVNGTEVSSKPVSGALASSSGVLRLGGNGVWGEYFTGLIDEVRVYNRALTAAQIQTDMNTAVGGGTPPPGPEVRGQFGPLMSWPLVPVHIAMLSNGKVAVWDGFDAALNSERVWDPATLAFDPVPSGRNLFCAGHVTLPDGRLFIAGGHVDDYEGTKDTHIFNPTTRAWFRGTDMARARWYPTVTTLPDGRILTLSGDDITLNAPGQPVPLTNASNTLPEIYNVAANTWTPLTAAQRRMPLYPFMFVLPDGRVFDAGPDQTTRTLNVATGQWTTVGNSPIDGHSAVMYRPGKILKSGTWADPDFPSRLVTDRAATIDMTAASPAWQEVAQMKHPRSYHTLTSLPDGTVLATGGATSSDGITQSQAVVTPEIWNPDTNTWTEMAAGDRPRLYHSSALLLPDGRVLLAGGGAFGTATNETNAEIFSPPYLFKGPRPTITSAPATLQHGQTFTISTPDAAGIQKVALMRMGSVTHNFDMDQRFMNLNFSAGGSPGTLSIDAPANANAAPPGRYMLFVVDGSGVPSVASLLTVEAGPADTQPPTQPGGPTATVSDDDVQLNWTASTDDRGVSEYRVHRSTTSGFTPSASNRIATVTSGTSYTDTGVSAGTHYYVVVAADAAGNTSPPSREEPATVAPDTTAPATSITAPAGGATVSGPTTVTATASDNRGVSSVQFRLDGTDLGAADTSAPYSTSWDTTASANGSHTLTAVARDAAGNATTSAPVTVTVDNVPVDTSGLVAAYGFEEASGSTVTDRSSAANDGTISGAARSASGRHGSALSFDGVNDWVTVPDDPSLAMTNAMTLSAWVRPTALTGWDTVLFKEKSDALSYGLYANSAGTNRPSGHVFTSTEFDTRGTSQLATGTWTHIATTYDGAVLRLYVDGAQVSSKAVSGTIAGGSGPLRIGGNSLFAEFYTGLIDEVRVYRRVQSAAEIGQDMNTPVVPTDTQAPTAPSNLTANGGLGQVALDWSAASDNVGVARYNVHRSTTSGFTPSAANRVAQVSSGTSYTDTGMAAGTYHYRVVAEDAVGNLSPASNQATATATADTSAPSVSLTAPANGATVSGQVTISATASDNVGVAGVRFKVDGADIGAEDTSAPYSTQWASAGVSNGSHTLTALARDAAGNTTTSSTVTVNVNNSAPAGLVAAYGFEEGSGTQVTDASGSGNPGAISGATRTTAGRFGSALSFDGVNDIVTVADASSLDMTTGVTLEAWVRPTTVSDWQTVLMKEQSNGLIYGLYGNSGTDRPSGHIFTSSEVDTRGTAKLAANTWTHLAMTYDGFDLRLYVDGSEVSSRPVSGSLLTSTGAVRLGGNNVWGEWFSGLIDEVRVYNRALTAAQVQNDLNRAVP